jgi:hypothetical protein
LATSFHFSRRENNGDGNENEFEPENEPEAGHDSYAPAGHQTSPFGKA